MRTNAQLAYNRQATAFETLATSSPILQAAGCGNQPVAFEADKDELLAALPKRTSCCLRLLYSALQQRATVHPCSHSLGSNMLVYLLSEYMEEHSDIYARMVAAMLSATRYGRLSGGESASEVCQWGRRHGRNHLLQSPG